MEILKGLFQLIILDFKNFVLIFNSISVEIVWIIFLLLCFFSILLLLKFFGKTGLYIYTVVAVIAANIQVLKLVNFSFFQNPIALGTILFSSTFLCTDILSEYYGSKSARKNILLGFSGFLLMTLFMLFTMGFKPLEVENISNDYIWALDIQENLLILFMPLPIFFVASMIAYFSSQFFDIWCFKKLSTLTNKKYLWFRNNFSTLISTFIDNTIFSIFAWIILNPEPLKIKTVFITFILGTYVLRMIIALIDTPFMYLAKYFLPNNYNDKF